MRVLGLHGGIYSLRDTDDMESSFAHHDGAAVLVEDGRVVAAAEEERFNRIKHYGSFPVESIEYCLAQAGIGIGDVDRIAVDVTERWGDYIAMAEALNDPALPLTTMRQRIGRTFQRELGVDVADRVRFIDHHLAHAWSAAWPSPLERALVVTMDGIGAGLTATVSVYDGEKIEVLKTFPPEKSLGVLYGQAISLVGYRRFDEYKVMGLAPYGDPDVYADVFERMYTLLPDGDYELTPIDRVLEHAAKRGLVHQARRKGEPFTQAHKDYSAGLQRALETIMFHLLRHWREQTGERNLAYAGGVALNSSFNGRLLCSGLFDRIWIQPAAHDAGNALGAALAVLKQEGGPFHPERMTHLYLGPGIGTRDEIGAELAAWGDFVQAERVDDVEARAARLLADGAVLGWTQGRAEFGPRALGNRSIVADPRPAENKDRINAMVKKREGYRPFAPSVLQDRVTDFFEAPPGEEFPFMLFVVNVRPEMREVLGAVTHVDASARIQTVSRDTNPRYWKLIDEFGKLTGIPVVLNTSFNNHAEPIVNSVEDSIVCFLTTRIDYLVVGDWLVSKRPVEKAAYRSLVPTLRRSRKLVARTRPGARRSTERAFTIDSTMTRRYKGTSVPISRALFDVLLAADGRRTLGELADAAGIDEAGFGPVLDEVLALWDDRVLELRPAAAGSAAA